MRYDGQFCNRAERRTVKQVQIKVTTDNFPPLVFPSGINVGEYANISLRTAHFRKVTARTLPICLHYQTGNESSVCLHKKVSVATLSL